MKKFTNEDLELLYKQAYSYAKAAFNIDADRFELNYGGEFIAVYETYIGCEYETERYTINLENLTEHVYTVMEERLRKEETEPSEKLKRLKEEKIAIEREISKQSESNRQKLNEINNMINDTINEIVPFDKYIIGNWACSESPIGVCIYDPEKDSELDDCIYCHEPDERK